MANSIDPNSGFCSETKIYRSLRPTFPLPPKTTPLSIADYVFSLLHSSPPPPNTAALINAVTHHQIQYSDLLRGIENLTSSLQNRFRLSKGDSAFVLSPNLLNIPILFCSLFSLGVIVSPSNPASTISEISHQLHLSKPVIAFATSDTANKIPSLRYGTVVLDSSEFESMMAHQINESHRVKVFPSDIAAILYSSGTTGRVKAVSLTHRNLIATVAVAHANRAVRLVPSVALCTAPYFHVYGFVYCIRSMAMGETFVFMERFDFRVMVKSVQDFRVSHLALSPPLVVAITKDDSAAVLAAYDLSSLEVVLSGGALLQKTVVEKFKNRFPNVQLAQAYGLTETTGRVFSTIGPKECEKLGSTGKLMANAHAMIIDTETGNALPPLMAGELWVKGPFIMKGYYYDQKSTAEILDSQGWLRTGDLCYIDNEGFLFFLDRIKELIKYKAYQVPPAELERLLHSHPDIVEAAVVPYPDEEAGQIPMACIVKQPGSVLDETEIVDFIAKQVAPYKKIRRVMFVDSIPKNVQGKVLRRELLKLALPNANSKL